MTTALTKPVHRVVPMRNGDRELVVAVYSWGLVLRGKGTARRLRMTWEQVAAAAPRPDEMPGGFMQNPLAWLTTK